MATANEFARLQAAAREAWEIASRAASADPRVGTPEWAEWQSLVDEAVTANLVYIDAVIAQHAG